MQQSSPRGASLVIIIALCSILASACASNPGDSRARQGARSGAAFGAGVGLLLGVLSGDPERAIAGAAVGAGVGASHGAYEGWRQDQDDERTRQVVQAITAGNAPQAGVDDEDRRREELTRFLGVWQMTGWAQEMGRQIDVSAQVNGNVHMGYFVEMAWIDLQADGFEGPIWGTTTLGYDADSGYSMITRFNTSPEAFELDGGSFSSSTRTFSFADAQGTTTLRFSTPDRFTVATVSDGDTVESYTFTRQ